ncbi:mRNA interferase MazF [Lachnospiraceae bacterium XBB1006]|nr:mRNA interferase MazF [Lachnospiraceae bacterium XBB1006]
MSRGKSRKTAYKTYKKGQVLYVDFGKQPRGVQGGIRPAVVVSCDESNHSYAAQITVCPISSKLKYSKVHVRLDKSDVSGYHLPKASEILPEDMQTVSKMAVRGAIGFLSEEKIEQLNEMLMRQLGLGRGLA